MSWLCRANKMQELEDMKKSRVRRSWDRPGRLLVHIVLQYFLAGLL